jgi:hypothetical protein
MAPRGAAAAASSAVSAKREQAQSVQLFIAGLWADRWWPQVHHGDAGMNSLQAQMSW